MCGLARGGGSEIFESQEAETEKANNLGKPADKFKIRLTLCFHIAGI